MHPLSASIWTTIGDSFDRDIVDAGRLPELLFLIAFLATFGITRAITHAIHSQRFARLHDVDVGATHVHHLVPGIALMIVSGYGAIAFDAPPGEVWAVLFGIGVALTLDEFALWLNLEDVYWEEEGRESVDVVIVFGLFVGLMLLGLHFWIEVVRVFDFTFDGATGGLGFVTAALAGVCVLKGKLLTGVAGLFIPFVAPIGAIRLAKPRSAWARSMYDEPKVARALKRFGDPARRPGRTAP